MNQGELKSVLEQLDIHLAEARKRRLDLDGASSLERSVEPDDEYHDRCS